jgi:hypothetical protein
MHFSRDKRSEGLSLTHAWYGISQLSARQLPPTKTHKTMAHRGACSKHPSGHCRCAEVHTDKVLLHTKMASCGCCMFALSGRWMSGCRTSCRMCLPQQSCPGSKSGRIGSITSRHTSTHPAINRRTSSQVLAGSRLSESVCSS